MELSFDRRLGIAGVLLAPLGIGITILWPDIRLLGWLFLLLGAVGLIIWLVAEIRAKLHDSLLCKLISVLIVIGILGGVGVLYWKSQKPKNHEPQNAAEQHHEQSQQAAPTSSLPSNQPLNPPGKTDHTPKSANPTAQHPMPISPAVEQPLTVIEAAPVFGNLGDRAVALSNEIMVDLYRHGWKSRPVSGGPPMSPVAAVQEMPTDGSGLQMWLDTRSAFFRWDFLERVKDMRNEFAQFHLRDEQLDSFLKDEEMDEERNRQIANPRLQKVEQISPYQIEEVAQRLKVLASQIPAK